MKKTKIMIVEDEVIISMDMARSLEMMGYDVVAVVSSGEEAIEKIKDTVPDLILMDIQLLGLLDGIQTVEEINKHNNIPIIYISEFTDELTLARAKITGPYGYIKKTFNYDELHTTIDMAVYKNTLQRRIVEKETLLNTTLENIDYAVITIDIEGYIQYLNSSASDLFRISFSQARNIKIDKLGFKWISEDGIEFIHPFLKKRRKRSGNAEYRLINLASGKEIPVECIINTLYDSNRKKKGFVYIIQNIEERKKMQDIKSQLASIVESSQDAIIGIDPDGIIISWNRGASEILGYSYEEVIGQNISMLTPENIPNELPEKIEDLKNGLSVDHYESLRQTKSGEIVEMSILPSPILDKRGNITGISFIARNITENKKLQKEIIGICERERERIGQDLHDSLGQQLTGILLNLKAVEKMIKKKISAEDYEQIKFTEETIKTAIEQTRTMAKTMVPVKLQTEGLPHELEGLANFAENVCKKEIDFKIDPQIPDIYGIISTQLFHIAQEAVNNAVKHGECDKISISLGIQQSDLVLLIRDNGKGFSEEAAGGIGISIMKYRANLIGGTLLIDGENDNGTLVLCRLPLSKIERSNEEDTNS